MNESIPGIHDQRLRAAMGEMLLALDAEKAEVTNASKVSAVAAKNGRLTQRVPEGYLYRFLVDVDLSLPTDTPLVIQVAERTIKGTLDRVVGRVVLVVLEQSIGNAVASATLRFNPVFLIERLKEVLSTYLEGSRMCGEALLLQAFDFEDPVRERETAHSAVPCAAGLDDAQARAVTQASEHSLRFVWGPPGTGKSSTLASLAVTLANRGERVLIASHTNVAIDNAIEKVVSAAATAGSAMKEEVLRLGPSQELSEPVRRQVDARLLAESKLPERVRPSEIRAYCLDARTRLHDITEELLSAVDERFEEDSDSTLALEFLRRLAALAMEAEGRSNDVQATLSGIGAEAGLAGREAIPDAEPQDDEDLAEILDRWEEVSGAGGPPAPEGDAERLTDALRELDAALSQATAHVLKVEAALVGRARIVGATLCKSYLHPAIVNGRFDAVLLDEVSMAWLPQVAAVGGRGSRRLVLFGDFRQLAPIAMSPKDVAAKWLRTDVFRHARIESAVDKGLRDDRLLVLDTQYRMHPGVAAAPSNLFYGGRLRNAERSLLPADLTLEFLPGKQAVFTVETSSLHPWGLKALGEDSRFNLVNAVVTAGVAARLSEAVGGAAKVGVVTPYRAQARVVRALLGDMGLEEVLVATVHRFQGLEREAMVFDLVDSKPHDVGILLLPAKGGDEDSIQRLMNVAMTRGRRATGVVANVGHLRTAIERMKTNTTLGRLLKEPGFCAPWVKSSPFVDHPSTRKVVRVGTVASGLQAVLQCIPTEGMATVLLGSVERSAMKSWFEGQASHGDVRFVVRTDTVEGKRNQQVVEELLGSAPRAAQYSWVGIRAPIPDLVVTEGEVSWLTHREVEPRTLFLAKSPALVRALRGLLRSDDLFSDLVPGPQRCLQCGSLITIDFSSGRGAERSCGCGETPPGGKYKAPPKGPSPECPTKGHGPMTWAVSDETGNSGWVCVLHPPYWFQ